MVYVNFVNIAPNDHRTQSLTVRMYDGTGVMCSSELRFKVCFTAFAAVRMLASRLIYESNMFLPFSPSTSGYDVLPVACITAEDFSASAASMSTALVIETAAPAKVSSLSISREQVALHRCKGSLISRNRRAHQEDLKRVASLG